MAKRQVTSALAEKLSSSATRKKTKQTQAVCTAFPRTSTNVPCVLRLSFEVPFLLALAASSDTVKQNLLQKQPCCFSRHAKAEVHVTQIKRHPSDHLPNRQHPGSSLLHPHAAGASKPLRAEGLKPSSAHEKGAFEASRLRREDEAPFVLTLQAFEAPPPSPPSSSMPSKVPPFVLAFVLTLRAFEAPPSCLVFEAFRSPFVFTSCCLQSLRSLLA